MSKKRKQLIIFAWITILLLFCSSCGNKNTPTVASCKQLALGMTFENETASGLVMVSFGDASFDDYLEINYGLSGTIADGCIIYSIDKYATEIAVLKPETDSFEKETSLQEHDIEEALSDYVESRIATYTGYFPEEVDKLENCQIFIKNEFVVLIISNHVNQEKKLFEEICSYDEDQLQSLEEKIEEFTQKLETNRSEIEAKNDEEAEIQTDNTENSEASNITVTSESQLQDMEDSAYFNQDIVTAYLTDQPDLLTDEKDLAVYEAVKEIIEKNIRPSMTTLEKEKIIHDYLCIHMDYDDCAFIDEEHPSPDANHPYGMLINGYGICSGYASTFKLFMDCLEIPCMVVEGKTYNLTSDHAWNKVYIDGIWYNVDVTWDDPVYTSGTNNESLTEWFPQYTFFNCSDEVLIMYDHQWNKSLYPECTESMEKSSYTKY